MGKVEGINSFWGGRKFFEDKSSQVYVGSLAVTASANTIRSTGDVFKVCFKLWPISARSCIYAVNYGRLHQSPACRCSAFKELFKLYPISVPWCYTCDDLSVGRISNITSCIRALRDCLELSPIGTGVLEYTLNIRRSGQLAHRDLRRCSGRHVCCTHRVSRSYTVIVYTSDDDARTLD